MTFVLLAFIANNRLFTISSIVEITLIVIYGSDAIPYRSTVEWLKNLFLERLEQVLNHIREEEHQHFTPSDFEAVDLDDEELNALFH